MGKYSFIIPLLFIFKTTAFASGENTQNLNSSMLLLVIFGLIILCVTTYIFAIKTRNTLKQIINFDELTNLVSEKSFLNQAEEILKSSNKKYSIYSIDIDNFKYINEVYGYETGSKVIQIVATKLEESFSNALLISRVFADKFLLFLETDDNIVNFNIENSVNDILGDNFNLKTSTGVYNIEDLSFSVPYMIDCANIARALNKNIYGSTKQVFTQGMQKELVMKNNVVCNMEAGIENCEFKMVYQPKVDFKTEKIVGAEALVRWIKQDGTQIFPDSFIPVFESNGFISKLDYYVFNCVCSFISKHENLPKISINVSGHTVLDKDLEQNIMSILAKHNISPSQVEIEITEGAIVHNFDMALEQINRLRQLGFAISMDDFGAGVSSLNRLKDMEIDVLKIDKQFLSETLIGLRGAAIIENIIKMSRQLDIKAVAEGVETSEQVFLLKLLDCDIAQGYFYSKPLDEQMFLEKIIEINGASV